MISREYADELLAGVEGAYPHQGEPKTAGDAHLGLEVRTYQYAERGSLKVARISSPELARSPPRSLSLSHLHL